MLERVEIGGGRFAGMEGPVWIIVAAVGWGNLCGVGAQLRSGWGNVLSRGKVSQPHLDMQKVKMRWSREVQGFRKLYFLIQ